MKNSDTRLSGDQLLGLVAMALAVFVIANDFTALSVALPAMEISFGVDITTVQWVITGYALVFGVMIVSGGRLADMYGRRRIFFIGSFIFALFSVLGGFAAADWQLLAARGLMGIGGAMMWPAVLGMTYSLVPAEKAGLAGGLIMGAAGIGNAVGPLLGGTLTDLLDWRWIFFLNLPIAVLAVLVTWRVVERDKPTGRKERIDYTGVAMLSVGLFALLLSLDMGTDLGWTDPLILGLFALSVVALLVFVFVERRQGENALVPGDVLANRAFFSACMATLMMSALFFAVLLYLPQFMSKQLGFSAMQSGAGLLPMMVTFALTSFVAGPLYARLGAKLIVSTGAAALSTGMFLLAQLQATSDYSALVPGMLVMGLGVGLFYSSITTAAITALDPSRASLAGAIVYMFQVAGGSIGLGLNTAIVVVAPSLAEGISRAFMLDTGLAVAGLLVSLFFIGGRLHISDWHKLAHRHRAHG